MQLVLYQPVIKPWIGLPKHGSVILYCHESLLLSAETFKLVFAFSVVENTNRTIYQPSDLITLSRVTTEAMLNLLEGGESKEMAKQVSLSSCTLFI